MQQIVHDNHKKYLFTNKLTETLNTINRYNNIKMLKKLMR